MTNIQPGPELDAKAAQVFGWEIDALSEGKIIYFDPNDDMWRVLPQLSTTWNGMQLVVEEMQRRGYEEVNLKRYEGMGGWRWAARFGNDGFEIGDSAPHAVCMAAISSLEGHRDAK